MLKKNVLRNKQTFSQIYKKGKSQGSNLVVVFSQKNDLDYNKLGFLASKKVGNSVKRNRARRLMKESYRKLEPKIKKGYNIVFIARNNINDKKCQDVERAMNFALKKSNLKK